MLQEIFVSNKKLFQKGLSRVEFAKEEKQQSFFFSLPFLLSSLTNYLFMD